jgi:hypothetical protein
VHRTGRDPVSVPIHAYDEKPQSHSQDNWPRGSRLELGTYIIRNLADSASRTEAFKHFSAVQFLEFELHNGFHYLTQVRICHICVLHTLQNLVIGFVYTRNTVNTSAHIRALSRPKNLG